MGAATGSAAGAVPPAPRDRRVPDRPARDADAADSRRRTRAGGGRGRAVPARTSRSASADQPLGRSGPRRDRRVSRHTGSDRVSRRGDLDRRQPHSGTRRGAAVTTLPAGGMTVNELRIALTVDEFEQAVAFYRDALGMNVLEMWNAPGANGVLLEAGRA